MSYPIPKPLWDALENVLMVKSKDLIKDIAKTLHQSEKPLLDAFKAKKQKFHLVDMEDPTDNKFECEAILCESAVAHRCRKPVILGQKMCPGHEFWKQPTLGTKPSVQRIKTDDGETYFVDTLMNVYTIGFDRVGSFQDGILTVFEIDEEEEYA
jgi:hypothetical protein